MELHESLRSLAESQGRGLFEDADGLRGALDDYLDEASASTGDINLLVDAVRLGALQSLVTIIASGADPHSAVVDAGGRLARDRGSLDLTGATWAVSALGYALGKVPDDLVRHYRAQLTSGQVPSGTAPRVSPPPAPTQSPVPPVQSPVPPVVSPVTSPPAPHQFGQYAPPSPPVGSAAGYPPPGASSYGGGSGRKRRLWPILVAAVVVVLLLGGAVVGLVVANGGGDNGGGGGEEGPDLSLGAVSQRYENLGTDVTSGVSECTETEAEEGETEKLECALDVGTLTLTTYADAADAEAARDAVLDTAEGTIVSDADSGVLYLRDPKVADPDSSAPVMLFWDSQAGVQSGLITAASGTTREDVGKAFREMTPTVQIPTEPVDDDLLGFIEQFSLTSCTRIPTEVAGETEESRCTRGDFSAWTGKFAASEDLRDYRQNSRTLMEADGVMEEDFWYIDDSGNDKQDFDEPEQGKVFGYIEDSTDLPVLYIDDLDCRCYLQMYGEKKDTPLELYRSIFG